MPLATQTVQNRKGKWQTVRFAECPTHQQRSTHFIGLIHEGWLFECRETDYHTKHQFIAKAPKYAPKTVEEAKEWFSQEVARVSRDSERTLK